VSRRQGQRWSEQEAAAAPPAPAPQAPAAGGQNDMIEQLKQLGALRDQGILTEDEFAAQKAKLLGG
jgi:hypothetical protein